MTNVIQIADQAAMPRVFDQPPEQLHPAQIAHAEFGDNPALKRASETLAFAWEGLASIDKLRASPHPEDKPATHARKVRQNVDGFDHAWATRWDGAKAELQAEYRRVESDLERTANLTPVESRFSAIVGTLQGMTPGQKAEALDRLIADQDGPTLATVIEAPLFLTGITVEQRDSIKLRLFNAINPAGVALREQLAKSLAKMETASIACIKIRAKLREGTDRFDKATKVAEDVANKARSGFAA